MAGNEHAGSRGADARVALGWKGLSSKLGDHIGHFYLDLEERMRLLIPFLGTGLKEGDKCVLLVSPEAGWTEVRTGLQRMDADVEGALKSGQLLVESGKKSEPTQREVLMEAISDTERRFKRLRWVGDMTWSLGRMPTTEELMKWETACNVIENPPAVFLCQYDLGRFPGNVVFDALKTHPLCIIRDAIHRNPFYEDPGAYLRELEQRRGSAQAAV